jgi:hypothetical protein
MTATPFSLIEDRLNEFLNNSFSLNKKAVVLSNIANPDGSLAITEKNLIIMSIVNIEQETSIKNRSSAEPGRAGILKANPPIFLNFHILFSSFFLGPENYKNGLVFLDNIVRFFQSNAVFTRQNMPGLDKDIERLSFELINLTFDEKGHLWSSLGAKYMPSLVYKVRVLRNEA